MSKVKQLLFKRQAGTRFRTWCYVSQKDLHAKEFERINDYTNSMQVQLTHLGSTMSKREKTTTEHLRDFQTRMGQIEKKVEVSSQKKADISAVKEMVAQVENRFAQ